MFARDKTSFLRFGDSRKEVGEIKKSSIFVL